MSEESIFSHKLNSDCHISCDTKTGDCSLVQFQGQMRWSGKMWCPHFYRAQKKNVIAMVVLSPSILPPCDSTVAHFSQRGAFYGVVAC